MELMKVGYQLMMSPYHKMKGYIMKKRTIVMLAVAAVFLLCLLLYAILSLNKHDIENNSSHLAQTAKDSNRLKIVLKTTDYEFSGRPIVPQYSVIFDGITLESGFEECCKNNLNVGKAALIVSAEGESVTAEFNILPATVSPTGDIISTDNSVTLTWTPSEQTDHYLIYRYDEGEKNWINIGSTKADTTSYTDTGLENAKTYHYSVRCAGSADNNDLLGHPSDDFKTMTSPKAPQDVAIINDTICWQESEGAVGYEIYGSYDAKESKLITTTANNNISIDGSDYSNYYVRSYCMLGDHKIFSTLSYVQADINALENSSYDEHDTSSASDKNDTDSSEQDENSKEDNDINKNTKLINVNNIMQYPELPTGCETTALTTLLSYLGFSVDKLTIARDYLPKLDFYWEGDEYCGADFRTTFAGDPESEYSYGCYAPCIVTAANNYLEDIGSALRATDMTGTDFESLLTDYIDNDQPVLIWVTSSDLHETQLTSVWKTPAGDEVQWVAYEHCVVLTGYDLDAQRIYVSDPLVGNTDYDLSKIRQRYIDMGQQCVAIG